MEWLSENVLCGYAALEREVNQQNTNATLTANHNTTILTLYINCALIKSK